MRFIGCLSELAEHGINAARVRGLIPTAAAHYETAHYENVCDHGIERVHQIA